jgi:hypothetical protein
VGEGVLGAGELRPRGDRVAQEQHAQLARRALVRDDGPAQALGVDAVFDPVPQVDRPCPVAPAQLGVALEDRRLAGQGDQGTQAEVEGQQRDQRARREGEALQAFTVRYV